MAEIYPLGENRIFYRTQGFIEDLFIAVTMTDPDLITAFTIFLTEFDGGLYYFDYTFLKSGTYIGVFYEDGVKRTSQAFSTRRIPAKGMSTFLGSNVINCN